LGSIQQEATADGDDAFPTFEYARTFEAKITDDFNDLKPD
jgi:hypothetical protein